MSNSGIGINRVETPSGIYYLDGRHHFHRDDGPAIFEYSGFVGWYQHGQHHRDGGPAVETNDGHELWYRYGKLHRTDGPAYNTLVDQKWYVHGERCESPKEYQFLAGLDDESMIVLLLKFGWEKTG